MHRKGVAFRVRRSHASRRLQTCTGKTFEKTRRPGTDACSAPWVLKDLTPALPIQSETETTSSERNFRFLRPRIVETRCGQWASRLSEPVSYNGSRRRNTCKQRTPNATPLRFIRVHSRFSLRSFAAIPLSSSSPAFFVFFELVRLLSINLTSVFLIPPTQDKKKKDCHGEQVRSTQLFAPRFL